MKLDIDCAQEDKSLVNFNQVINSIRIRIKF